MHWKRPIVLDALTVLAACAALLAGCGGGSNGSSSTETGFNRSLSDASRNVQTYADSSDPAGDATGYQARVTDDLDDMDQAWNQMRAACDDFPECPGGGGMTGKPNGNCMPNGHMMDDRQMSDLHDAIASARTELNEYCAACCASFDPATCESYRQRHTQMMRGLFDQMRDDCDQWWSIDDGPWGDCPDHHGSNHQGPAH